MPTTEAWTARCWSEFRAGNLTRAFRDVLLTLRTFRGHGGIAWPSHETLASRAGCCVRTVQRALQQAQHLGLVSWVERRVRAGWRWLRTSNAYRLLAPIAAVISAQIVPKPRRQPTTGQCDRGVESRSKKEAIQQMMQAAAGLPDLLAMRRAAFAGSRGNRI
jgi:DNA-binding transcriptional MocR family regulator